MHAMEFAAKRHPVATWKPPVLHRDAVYATT